MAFIHLKTDRQVIDKTSGKVTKKQLKNARFKARKRGQPAEEAPKYWQRYLYQLLLAKLEPACVWELKPFRGRRYEADISYPSCKLAIEVDEWHAHRRLHQMNADREKDIWFMKHGWRVLRFTDDQVKKSPLRCVEEVAWILTQLRGWVRELPPGENPDSKNKGFS